MSKLSRLLTLCVCVLFRRRRKQRERREPQITTINWIDPETQRQLEITFERYKSMMEESANELNN